MQLKHLNISYLIYEEKYFRATYFEEAVLHFEVLRCSLTTRLTGIC